MKSWIVFEADHHFEISNQNPVKIRILDIITRYPMQTENLKQILNNHPRDNVSDALPRLEKTGKAKIVDGYGKRFYSSTGASNANDH